MKNKPVVPKFSKKLVHLGIVVKDMDQAIKRMESYGIGPFRQVGGGDPSRMKESLPYKGKPFTPDCKASVTTIGELEIEMFEPGKADSPWKEFLETHGEGVEHVGFAANDLDKEVAEMNKQGADIMMGAKWGKDGGGIYMDLGVGGLVIELIKK